jgi:hypothetical protein
VVVSWDAARSISTAIKVRRPQLWNQPIVLWVLTQTVPFRGCSAQGTFSRSVMVRSPSAAVDDTLTVNAAAVDHEGSREGRVLSIYWIREAFDRFSDGGYS